MRDKIHILVTNNMCMGMTDDKKKAKAMHKMTSRVLDDVKIKTIRTDSLSSEEMEYIRQGNEDISSISQSIDDLYLNCFDEDAFIHESFYYLDDLIGNLSNLRESIKYIKLSDEEIEFINFTLEQIDFRYEEFLYEQDMSCVANEYELYMKFIESKYGRKK